MMTSRIKGLERRLMPVGKIRCGDQQEYAKGKKRPHVLERPRLTTSNAFLLHEAAKLYGGTVQRWEDAPGTTSQWELYVEVDAIPILIPPMDTLSQCFECWSAKGCLRRCDNETITYALDVTEVGQPCVCPDDPEARQELAKDGKACKLTTRISCMLPDLPGIGLWSLETHSYYASVWTAGMVEFLEQLAKEGRICEAMLRIERMTRKGRNGVRNFAIPTIMPQQMTPRQLFAPQIHAALLPPDVQETGRLLEAGKTLQDHIGDLYGDTTPPAHNDPDPLPADEEATRDALLQEIQAVRQAGGEHEAGWTRYQAAMAKRCQVAEFREIKLAWLSDLLMESRAWAAKERAKTIPVTPTAPPGPGHALTTAAITARDNFAWTTLTAHQDDAGLDPELRERIQAALSPLAPANDQEAYALADIVLAALDHAGEEKD